MRTDTRRHAVFHLHAVFYATAEITTTTALCIHLAFHVRNFGTDLFDYEGAHLLVADYYSKYTVLRKLNSITSAAAINLDAKDTYQARLFPAMTIKGGKKTKF